MRSDIPIGIMTKDRPAYLAATLHSLSATTLASDQLVYVFDDHSHLDKAKRFLYTTENVDIDKPWPVKDHRWRKLGLDVLQKLPTEIPGLQNKVAVRLIGSKPQGVVKGSYRAIKRLFDDHSDAPGVILLQDDVVFNVDWFQRLSEVLEGRGATAGVVAGCRISKPLRPQDRGKSVITLLRRLTAQCLYLSRNLYDAARDVFAQPPHASTGFDNHLCALSNRHKLPVLLMNPVVCQHIGMVSLVRPKVTWKSRGPNGRVAYSAKPPYVLATEIKTFSAK